MTSLSIKTRTQFGMPVALVRPSSGRRGPSLAAPHSGVQERLSNPWTCQPSNSWSSVCDASCDRTAQNNSVLSPKPVHMAIKQ
jgi:hypothetical protein